MRPIVFLTRIPIWISEELWNPSKISQKKTQKYLIRKAGSVEMSNNSFILITLCILQSLVQIWEHLPKSCPVIVWVHVSPSRYIFWYLACTVWPNPRRWRRAAAIARSRYSRRTAARSPRGRPAAAAYSWAYRGAQCTATEYATAYCATAVGGGGGGSVGAAACAVKKGVYLRQAKSADVVCM